MVASQAGTGTEQINIFNEKNSSFSITRDMHLILCLLQPYSEKEVSTIFSSQVLKEWVHFKRNFLPDVGDDAWSNGFFFLKKGGVSNDGKPDFDSQFTSTSLTHSFSHSVLLTWHQKLHFAIKKQSTLTLYEYKQQDLSPLKEDFYQQ